MVRQPFEHDIIIKMMGFLITPIALILAINHAPQIQRFLRRSHFAKIPGIPAVSGVVVAKTTSKVQVSATRIDLNAKLKI
jgi:hypothetical protein